MSNTINFQEQLDLAKTKAREQAQARITQARMDLLKDQSYLDTLTNLEVANITNSTMQQQIEACIQVTVDVPVYNKSTRQERKWSGRYLFEFGADIQNLYHLATGIMYSVKDHKQLMLAITKLDIVAIEAFVVAMGTPAYFNSTYSTIVDSTPFNPTLAGAYAAVLGDQLGLALDTSKLNKTDMQAFFDKEEAKAKLQLEESQSTPDSPFIIE